MGLIDGNIRIGVPRQAPSNSVEAPQSNGWGSLILNCGSYVCSATLNGVKAVVGIPNISAEGHLSQVEQTHNTQSYNFIKRLTEILKVEIQTRYKLSLGVQNIKGAQNFIQSVCLFIYTNLVNKSALCNPLTAKQFTGNPLMHLQSGIDSIYAPFKDQYEAFSQRIQEIELEIKSNPRTGLMNAQQALIETKKAQQDFVRNEIYPAFFKAAVTNTQGSSSIVSGLLTSWGKFTNIPKKYENLFVDFFPIFMMVDKKKQEEIFSQNPHSFRIKQGIKLLSDDIMNVAFDCFKVEPALHANLKEFLTPYFHHILIKLVNEQSYMGQDEFVEIINSVLTNMPAIASKEELSNPEEAIKAKLAEIDPDKTYAEFIGKYNLHFWNTKATKQTTLRQALKDLYLQENEKKSVLLVEGLFDSLQFNLEKWGLSASGARKAESNIKKFVLKETKKYFLAPVFDLKQMEVTPLKSDSIAGTALKMSTLTQAIPAILHTQLNNKLNINIKDDDGSAPLVSMIVKQLGNQARNHGQKFSFLKFLGDRFKNGDLTPLVKDAVSLVNSDTKSTTTHKAMATATKNEVVDLVQPLLTNLILKAIVPILEKEKKGGIQFDQSLVLSSMKLLNDYFKELNSMGKTNKKYSKSKAIIANQHFYNNSANQILDLFLPNKAISLQELFPSLEPEIIDSVWQLIEKELPSWLESLKELIFDKTVFRDILIDIYKTAIATLDNREEKTTAERPLNLSLEEFALQDEMKATIKDLVFNAASLTDLPIGKLLKVINYLPVGQDLVDVVLQSITNSVQKKLDGQLIAKIAETGLQSQIKLAKTDISPRLKNKNRELDQLEKKFVQSALSYAIWSKNKSIDNLLSRLDIPVVKQIKDAIVGTVRFLLYKIIGNILIFFGIKKAVVYLINYLLRRNRVKLQNSVASPEKHEDIAHKTIRLINQIVKKDWGTSTSTTVGS